MTTKYWPERVKEICRNNKSPEIAHDLAQREEGALTQEFHTRIIEKIKQVMGKEG